MRRALLLLVFLFCVISLWAADDDRSRTPPDVDLNRITLPQGFHISIFAKVPKARFMTFSPGGVLLVTATSEGKVVALPDSNHSGKAERAVTLAEDLNAPHGIAFHEGKLYVGDTNAVLRYDWNESQLKVSNQVSIAKLSPSGMHFTRTLLFQGGKLYVSIGSDCNVCIEKDPERAAVIEMNPDGSGRRVFAQGLRNSVGLAINPKTNTIWGTDNGRDWLGDNLPPDKVNELKSGGDYGWPYCYAQRKVDPEHEAEGKLRCPSTIPPKLEMQAHSAPLGITFYEGKMFPPEYQGAVFVAMHGSWNRTVPTGYKLTWAKMGANGEPASELQDFATGWLKPGETRRGVWMGRPVGVITGPDGALYVSDDYAGLIYRITYSK